MRITFVNRMMGIFRGGGELFDLNMARALRALGADVRFVVGRRWSRLDEPLDEFETHYIATPYLRGLDYRYGESRFRAVRALTGRARRFDDRLFRWAALRHLARDRDTDVFQICALADLGARLSEMGRKAVVRWPGPPSAAAAAYAKRCSGSFSHGTSYEGAKERGLNPAYIVAGCDAELFKPLPQRNRADGACRFLFVGRCIPVKNLGFLVDGFQAARQQRPGISLCIVGDGEVLPGIRKKVTDLGLAGSVTFAGFRSGPALAACYQDADCFVLVSRYESFSLVALEAMSSGLPLVLSRVGHLPRFVEQFDAGTLVDPGDVNSLAGAMVWWADHAEARRETGERNRRTIEDRFSWEASARALLAFYESLLDPAVRRDVGYPCSAAGSEAES